MDMLEPTWSRRLFLQALGSAPLVAASGGLIAPPAFAAAGAGSAATLQQTVNRYIKAQRRAGRVARDELTAWSVYDFTSGRKLVSINENTPYQSASMIKPFIAQAYFFRHQQNPRRYPYNATIANLMESMIRRSSNRATNELIERIGERPRRRRPREVEQLLKKRAGGIFRHTSIVEYIPRGGRTYRNMASARDYSRFLYALWNQNLPFARDIQDYMGLSNDDRIINGAPVIPPPPLTQIYDKTGSTARLCGNMGIVVARGEDGKTYPYTFIGIIQKRSRARPYGRWISRRGAVMREVSGLVYQTLREHYRLV